MGWALFSSHINHLPNIYKVFDSLFNYLIYRMVYNINQTGAWALENILKGTYIAGGFKWK